MDRRQALLSFLNSTLQAAGAVVLASSALPATAHEQPSPPVEGDLEKRASRVACTPEPSDPEEEFCSFRNGGFRNGGGGGGFRKGGFVNGGGGGGGFRKGGFANGGFGNGGFRKGGFVNGGFRNF